MAKSQKMMKEMLAGMLGGKAEALPAGIGHALRTELGEPLAATEGILTPGEGVRKGGAKGLLGKLGGGKIGMGKTVGIAVLLPFILDAMFGGEPPEVVSAEERMKGLEGQQALAEMQMNMTREDPGLYTGLLQFLSGQSPVTGLSENAVRFGGTQREVPDELIQSALLQLMG